MPKAGVLVFLELAGDVVTGINLAVAHAVFELYSASGGVFANLAAVLNRLVSSLDSWLSWLEVGRFVGEELCVLPTLHFWVWAITPEDDKRVATTKVKIVWKRMVMVGDLKYGRYGSWKTK